MVLKAEFSHLFKFPFEQVIDAYFKKVKFNTFIQRYTLISRKTDMGVSQSLVKFSTNVFVSLSCVIRVIVSISNIYLLLPTFNKEDSGFL